MIIILSLRYLQFESNRILPSIESLARLPKAHSLDVPSNITTSSSSSAVVPVDKNDVARSTLSPSTSLDAVAAVSRTASLGAIFETGTFVCAMLRENAYVCNY